VVARTTTRVDRSDRRSSRRRDRAVKATALPLIASPSRGSSPRGGTSSAGRTASTSERILAKHLGAVPYPAGRRHLGCVPLGPGTSGSPSTIAPPHSRSSTPDRGTPPQDLRSVHAVRARHLAHLPDPGHGLGAQAVLNGLHEPDLRRHRKDNGRGDQRSRSSSTWSTPSSRRGSPSPGRTSTWLGSNFYPYCIDYIRNAGHHKPSMLPGHRGGRRPRSTTSTARSSSTAPRPASPPRTTP